MVDLGSMTGGDKPSQGLTILGLSPFVVGCDKSQGESESRPSLILHPAGGLSSVRLRHHLEGQFLLPPQPL